MRIEKLENFKWGWIIGNFEPVLLKTELFEIAVKYWKAEEYQQGHVHRVATQYTIIVSGQCKIDDTILMPGTILVLEPKQEFMKYECLQDSVNVVIKVPSVIGDKYIV